jgi:hypothetical protein
MKTLSLTLWLLLTLFSFFGAVLALTGMSSMSYSSGGSTAPLQGAGYLFGLGICAVCIGVFALCLKSRPPAETLAGSRFIIAVVSSVAVFGGLYFAAHWIGHYSLTIHVMNSDEQPIPGAAIKIESFRLGDGIGKFDHLAEGTVSTDFSGNAKITTNHAHEIGLYISASGFKTANVWLHASGYNYPQQLGFLNAAVSVNGKTASNSEDFPRNGNILLTVMLPGPWLRGQSGVESPQ